jgi:hypothetical protein
MYVFFPGIFRFLIFFEVSPCYFRYFLNTTSNWNEVPDASLASIAETFQFLQGEEFKNLFQEKHPDAPRTTILRKSFNAGLSAMGEALWGSVDKNCVLLALSTPKQWLIRVYRKNAFAHSAAAAAAAEKFIH